MEQSLFHRTLRDIAAVLVVTIFMFPLFWWALTSIKPMYAIFNKDKVVVFDFVPTLINYAVVLLGWSRSEIAIESGSTLVSGAPVPTIHARPFSTRSSSRSARRH